MKAKTIDRKNQKKEDISMSKKPKFSIVRAMTRAVKGAEDYKYHSAGVNLFFDHSISAINYYLDMLVIDIPETVEDITDWFDCLCRTLWELFADTASALPTVSVPDNIEGIYIQADETGRGEFFAADIVIKAIVDDGIRAFAEYLCLIGHPCYAEWKDLLGH